MNLIIDRGNTFVKWAIFEDDEMRFKGKARALDNDSLMRMARSYPIEHIMLSSTRGIHFDEKILDDIGHYVRLDHHTLVPFKNNYKTPETLGRDRMAVTAAVVEEWPGKDALIVDTGTCITVDFLDAGGHYLGGNISPGPELRFMAMHKGTAALPMVTRARDFELVGSSTEAALQSGGYGGCIAEIIGWIDLVRERFSNPIVVISGGDATSFATSIKNEIFVRPDLVLTGLNKILNLNVNKT